MSYNLKKSREHKIFQAIDKFIGDFLDGKTSGIKTVKRILTKAEYDEYFSDKKKTIQDFKKAFSSKKNIKEMINNIGNVNINLFDDENEYIEVVEKIIKEIITDRIATQKDKKNENMEILKFEKFFESLTNIEKNVKIFEIKLPILKLEEILNDVNAYNEKTYKSVLVSYYKIYDEYIDVVDKKKHLFKVNDMKGYIMNNNRVSFDVIIFHKYDMESIKKNIVDMSYSEAMNLCPEKINIFGIDIKISSFINKEELLYVFDQNIIPDMVVNIITGVSNLKFEGKFQDFYIWSNKK